jgi:hypothetical protein
MDLNYCGSPVIQIPLKRWSEFLNGGIGRREDQDAKNRGN